MRPDFSKSNGLIPVIVQDALSMQVLMLGYMNEEAYNKTISEQKVTFFSRVKDRLWTKGETSGHFLLVHDIKLDCDKDTLLVQAIPQGPTCHTGALSCFSTTTHKGFLYKLEKRIGQRINDNIATSYTNMLYRKGINKVAQKVGEEAVELIIESKDNNRELFRNEAADLLYHFLILLKAKGSTLEEIESILSEREK